jgi:hypothetical protein
MEFQDGQQPGADLETKRPNVTVAESFALTTNYRAGCKFSWLLGIEKALCAFAPLREILAA